MKIHSLGLAAAALLALASPVAAQTAATLAVRDATGTTRYLCETADTNGVLTNCSPAGPQVVSGQAADGVAPVNPAVHVAGKDAGGLKRTLLTGTDGSLYVAGPVLTTIAASTKPVTSFGAITVGTPSPLASASPRSAPRPATWCSPAPTVRRSPCPSAKASTSSASPPRTSPIRTAAQRAAPSRRSADGGA